MVQVKPYFDLHIDLLLFIDLKRYLPDWCLCVVSLGVGDCEIVEGVVDATSDGFVHFGGGETEFELEFVEKWVDVEWVAEEVVDFEFVDVQDGKFDLHESFARDWVGFWEDVTVFFIS